MKLNRRTELTISGLAVSHREAIELHESWQMVSYLPVFSIEATVALSDVADRLHIAKDDRGRFYVPEYNFSNIGAMEPGEGYYLKMNEEAELIYRLHRRGGQVGVSFINENHEIDYLTSSFPPHPVTSENMSLLLISEPDVECDIGVYSNGILRGSGVLRNGRTGIAVWGDDEITPKIDGAFAGDKLELRTAEGEKVDFSVLEGQAVYTVNAFAVLIVERREDHPTTFRLSPAYPNPFNASTRLTYDIDRPGLVTLKLFDIAGRQIKVLEDGYRTARRYEYSLNAGDLPSGVYVVRLERGAEVASQKIILMK